MPALDALAPTAAVVGVAAIVQYAAGFGFALVSVPLLALVMDAHDAVLVALLVGTLGNLTQAIEGRRVVDHAVVARILAASLAGMPLGWLVFTRTDARGLQIAIGVAVLITVVALTRGASLHRANTRVDLVVGGLAGFLTTCTGTNGPPIVALLQARREPAEVFRATTTTTFLGLDVIAMGLYAVTGHLTLDHVVRTAATLPALLVGAHGHRQCGLTTRAEGTAAGRASSMGRPTPRSSGKDRHRHRVQDLIA